MTADEHERLLDALMLPGAAERWREPARLAEPRETLTVAEWLDLTSPTVEEPLP